MISTTRDSALQGSHLTNVVLSEVYIWYRFSGRDLIICLCSMSALLIGLFYRGKATLSDVALIMLQNILHLYVFNLFNQINGIEEDRVNKPDRPIPSGLVTLRQAKFRLGVMIAIYIMASYALCGLLGVICAVGWIVDTMMHEHSLHIHWFSKNFATLTLGVMFMLLPPLTHLQAIKDLYSTSPVRLWCFLVCVGIGIGGTMQDLRDVAGDALKKRKTLPIMIGDSRARKIHCASMIFLAAYSYFILHLSGTCEEPVDQTLGYFLHIGEVILYLSCLYLALRVVKYTTPQEDHITFQLFCLGWFVLIFLISGFVIRFPNVQTH